MPLYPYRCTQCGHRFEKIQKFNDAPEKVCPECGGQVERLLTAPGLQFKGAGWYVNDYAPKSSSASESAPKESAPAADSEAKKPASETKTEPSSGAASTGNNSTPSTSAKSGAA